MSFVPLDSPIRSVPKSLHRRQILYLDGIRYCFEAFELVSLRLERTLHTIGQREDDSNPISLLIVEATTDAWCLIDITHRLRELLQQTPQLKKSTPQLQVFLRRSESIEELRNYFQHFRTEIHSLAERGIPLWGTLSWVFGESSKEVPSNHLIVPGTYFTDCQAVGCIFDTHELKYIERVVLHAGQTKVDLADLHDAVEQFVEFYISWFQSTFTETERHGADIHIQFSLKPILKRNHNHIPRRECSEQSIPPDPTVTSDPDGNV